VGAKTCVDVVVGVLVIGVSSNVTKWQELSGKVYSVFGVLFINALSAISSPLFVYIVIYFLQVQVFALLIHRQQIHPVHSHAGQSDVAL
jgi:Na+/serine symporter